MARTPKPVKKYSVIDHLPKEKFHPGEDCYDCGTSLQNGWRFDSHRQVFVCRPKCADPIDVEAILADLRSQKDQSA